MCMNCYEVKFVKYKGYTSDFVSGIIFEMLIVTGVIENSQHCIKPEGLLSCAQEAAPWIEEGEFRIFDVHDIVRAVFCPSGPPVTLIFAGEYKL